MSNIFKLFTICKKNFEIKSDLSTGVDSFPLEHLEEINSGGHLVIGIDSLTREAFSIAQLKAALILQYMQYTLKEQHTGQKKSFYSIFAFRYKLRYLTSIKLASIIGGYSNSLTKSSLLQVSNIFKLFTIFKKKLFEIKLDLSTEVDSFPLEHLEGINSGVSLVNYISYFRLIWPTCTSC